MRPGDIAELVDVGDPRLSPDGAQVAFVVTTVDLGADRYQPRVWVAATDGSDQPRPVTADGDRAGSPRWAPDGASLAYVVSIEDEGDELRVVRLGRDEHRTIAAWKESLDDVAWSPDGTMIAFTARCHDERADIDKAKHQRPRRIDRLQFRRDDEGWTADRRRHLFVVAAGGGEPRALTTGDVEDDGLTWSPDGASIVFASGRHDTWDRDLASDLFRVRVDAGSGAEPKRLTTTGPAYSHPSYRPDGSAVAFLVDDPVNVPRHGQVGVVPADGRPRVLTADLDRQCAPYPAARPPVWIGDDLLFTLDDAGNVHLYRVAADGSKPPSAVVTGERQVTAFDAVGSTVAFTATTPTALPELFVLRAGNEHRLTSFGAAFAAAHPPAAPERFAARSPDGSEVEAWVIRPAGFRDDRRYPMLLNVHGGPFAQYGNRLFDEFQIQAAAGYVVVYANPRGSSGYTEAWGRAIRGATAKDDPGSGWGGVDYDDLMAVVDEALARYPFIDPERLGVLGGSYGGYMAAWMVSHTKRFRAACSERSANNLLALEYSSDFVGTLATEMGVNHLDDPDEYRRCSPVSYAADIDTPLLILHSEQDLRCPIGQAEELFVALRLLGRPVEFWRFPGESHELSRSGAPCHRIERAEIILDWFGRHLGPEALDVIP